jgi:hypothetical protein
MADRKSVKVISVAQGLDIVVEPCNPDVVMFGQFVCRMRADPTEEAERFVRIVKARSGEVVDWMYVNNRPAIYTLGDPAVVLNFVYEVLTEFKDEFQYFRVYQRFDVPSGG